MYSITVVNSTGEYTLFNTFDDELKVVNPVLSLELNKSGTLTFQMAESHPNKDQILPLASEIYVYNNGSVYWIGRPISIDSQFDLMATVTCEGILGYLLDTQVPPFNFTESNSIKGTECVKVFLQRLIGAHNTNLTNNWVDSRKKFVVGTVEIRDPNANLARSSENYNTTLDTINEKLLNSSYGGYIRVREVGSTRYIDYVETFGASTQKITFGENLLDLTTHVKTDTLYTVVIPQGAEIGDSGKRVDLLNYNPSASVASRIRELTHGGAKYIVGSSNSFSSSGAIYDAEGVSRHGRVFVEMTTDDITTQESLALKAAKYIGEVSVLGETLELSAVDLSSIDVDYNRFNIGEFANVISLPHNVNAEYQITQMNIDLYNPANSSMTLGGELRTFTFDNTKKIVEFNNAITEEVSSAVQNAKALLSGGLGGYLIIRQDESGQPYEILIMNQATEVAATNCVRINKNGLGFGRKAAGQSAASWVYRNAWTIDGNLIADFITTGTLNANLLKTGTISDPHGNTTINLSNGTLSMTKGSIDLGGGNFSVSDSGVLTIKRGSINLGSGNFTVNDSGALKAVSGTIGGFTLGKSWLRKAYASTMDFSIYAPSSFTGPLIEVSAGTASAFRVSANGALYCRPAPRASTIGLVVFEVTSSAIYIDPNRTSSYEGNLFIDSNGLLYKGASGSSSRKIKHDIKPVTNDDLKPERLYDAEVIQYKYNDDFLDENDPNRGKDLIGFVVEDLHEVYPVAVADDAKDSRDWTWSPYKMIPPMLKLIQDQKKQIDDLEARVSKLEALITKGE